MSFSECGLDLYFRV